jgi:F-type H+-transporting ATPase subunit epsilon
VTQFHLKIVTPDGLRYDGMAESLTVRTANGDLGILARHTNCVAPLGMGEASVVLDGKRRTGACIGGMVSVLESEVTVVATTFEWAEDIDRARAHASEEAARQAMAEKNASATQLELASAKLKRALIRQSVYDRK